MAIPVSKQEQEIKEKVVQIRRVTKVVKGGKKMSFRAVVVVGDLKTRVGLGIGKANEVPAAIRKGVEAAKRSMIEVPLISGTIPHDIIGKFSASQVVLRPAPHGTGVIAGGSVRTVLELCGLKNIVAKKIGSANAINVARATLNALSLLKRLEMVALLRGKEPKVRNVQA
jgi:small subunit ribosomal protein S5